MKNFSLVIINYNKNGYIQRVATKVRQLVPEIEMILADDHSDDGSYEWALKSKLFDHVYRKETREQYCLSKMRNEGMRLATNQFVVLLDGDCFPEKDYFRSLMKLMKHWKDKKTVGVGFTDHYDKEGCKILLEDIRKSYLADKEFCPVSWRDSFGGNICIPVAIWRDVGGFDEEFDGFWGYEDLEFAFRCTKSGARLCSVKGMVVRHLQHPLSAKIEQSNLNGRNYHLMVRKHPETA